MELNLSDILATHNNEQADATHREVARALRQFFTALEDAGFDDKQALTLTTTFYVKMMDYYLPRKS